jgi:hypothetical protein
VPVPDHTPRYPQPPTTSSEPTQKNHEKGRSQLNLPESPASRPFEKTSKDGTSKQNDSHLSSSHDLKGNMSVPTPSDVGTASKNAPSKTPPTRIAAEDSGSSTRRPTPIPKLNHPDKAKITQVPSRPPVATDSAPATKLQVKPTESDQSTNASNNVPPAIPPSVNRKKDENAKVSSIPPVPAAAKSDLPTSPSGIPQADRFSDNPLEGNSGKASANVRRKPTVKAKPEILSGKPVQHIPGSSETLSPRLPTKKQSSTGAASVPESPAKKRDNISQDSAAIDGEWTSYPTTPCSYMLWDSQLPVVLQIRYHFR